MKKKMKKSHLIIVDQFSSNSTQLRQHFSKQFQDPLKTDSNRFVWDYWHVPDQYTLLRTPAYHYFPESLYMKIHHEIVMWGRKNLGCWDISPPWLSCYIDGCKQELHSDVPHGPWAWVYSLTPDKKEFVGGETLLFKPEVLQYWSNFTKTQDRELNSFVDRVPAKMNRLIVFDPRIPHGVTEVKGTKDPREGRLVIHGWFTEPKTYIDGYIPEKIAEKKLNTAFEDVLELIGQFPQTQGVVSIKLSVSTTGKVLKAEYKTNTLIHLDNQDTTLLSKKILQLYQRLEFPIAKGKTEMIIPLVFS